MKHIFRAFVALVLCFSLVLALGGCSFIGGGTAEVAFVIGDQAEKISVPYGDKVSPPLNPKAENRIFCGWYTDPALENEYDFSTPVYRDLALYAGFVLDGAAITNEITISVMPALVTVENVYKTGGGREMTAQGSGFIYKIENETRSVSEDDLIRIRLVGTRELGRYFDTETILSSLRSSYYYAEIKDDTRVRISADDFKNDISLKGEFIRGVLEDEALSDKEKEAVINLGLSVLLKEV